MLFEEIDEFCAYVMGIFRSNGNPVKSDKVKLWLPSDNSNSNRFCRAVDQVRAKHPELQIDYACFRDERLIISFAVADVHPPTWKLFEQKEGIPITNNDALALAFVRGYLESSKNFRISAYDQPKVQFTLPDPAFLKDLTALADNVVCTVNDDEVTYVHVNALDLLSNLYDTAETFYQDRRKAAYLFWADVSVTNNGAQHDLRVCKVLKLDENAVLPSKLRASDCGYDLTLISESARFGKVVLYDTGIAVQPAHGWYAQIVPRSSLIKTGYMLANSVGIVDRSYTGSLKVALVKIDDSQPDLQLPARVAQLIFTPVAHFAVKEVSKDEFLNTERGDKGFGSSGVRDFGKRGALPDSDEENAKNNKTV